MLFPYHATNVPFCKQPLKAMAGWRRQGDGVLTACLRLASLWPLLLPHPVPGSLLSEAYQSQIAVASVKQSGICDGRGEAYYFGART
jgi:hypothetical protein